MTWGYWSDTFSNSVSFTITPPMKALITSMFAPTVTTSSAVLLTPTPATLTTATFVPVVATGGEWGDWSAIYSNTVVDAIVVIPDVATLLTATFAPSVTGGSSLPVGPVFQANVFQADVFQVEASPSVMVTPSPATLTLTTYVPSVSGAPPGDYPDVTDPTVELQWAYSSPGSHPQMLYQVVLTDFTSGAVTLDTGIVVGDEESVEVPADTLENDHYYEWYVTVWDDQGLSGTMATAGFITTFALPPTPTGLAGEPDAATSSVLLTWAASTLPAGEFEQWVIYRKDSADAPFVQIGTVEDQGTLAYTDYGCPLGVAVTYQLTQDNGWAESTGATTVETLPAIVPRSWQLVVGGDERLTIEFAQGTVKAAPSEMEAPSETYRVIGRTVPITETGILGGASGSLLILLRSDTLYLEGRILEIQRSNQSCWLKDAYGTSTLVRITALHREPGTVGRTDITVDWVQVD